ncbi:MAG: endolytic transglycosylase MltG [Anaerostipes sp.]|nr:endolytic transglycosylase MltG [Anaerostipes sp.]
MDLYLKEKKKHKKGKILLVVLILCAICIGAVLFAMGDVKGNGKKVEFTIPKGQSIITTAERLKDKQLIASKWGFVIYAKLTSYGDDIKHGVHTLKSGMTKKEILKNFTTAGSENTITFTIPEGYSVEMIGDLLEKKGVCKKADFYKAASTTEGYTNDFLKDIPKRQGYYYILEGYLYPDTYNVYKRSTAKQVVQKMLDNFQGKYNAILKEKKYTGKHSMFELVTMASIIEREAEIQSERPMIAGVIENRLRINMKLQMCPTVLYVTTKGKYDANKVYYSDLKVKSPYNTYVNKGLPVGPICNSDDSALKAAMSPDKNDYLFYHTNEEKKDGSHIFTKTYKEHEDTQIIDDKSK